MHRLKLQLAIQKQINLQTNFTSPHVLKMFWFIFKIDMRYYQSVHRNYICDFITSVVFQQMLFAKLAIYFKF